MANVPRMKDSPLWEYSVVYTDRAYNLMAGTFKEAMRDISGALKRCYKADSIALIPGSGTYGMEAVAWQFGAGKNCMVVRNGYFSFRWSDIFNVTQLPCKPETVIKARPVESKGYSKVMPTFAPCPIEEVVAMIGREKPYVVFAPHVETSTGMLLPDSYIRSMADAVHAYGGFLVIDAIAAGSVWCDMSITRADVVLSAPQKGWSGPACCAFVMLSERAATYVRDPRNQAPGVSFCCNLRQWLDVMDQYENKSGSGPGFRYYTTLPTDSLMKVRDAIKETEAFGFQNAKNALFTLGNRVRQVLEERGFPSVAACGFKAPGVVVSYSPGNPSMGAKFKKAGVQIAGGVPFKLDEDTTIGLDSKKWTFRIGLFGLDKWKNVDEVVTRLEVALDSMELSPCIQAKM